MGYFKVQFWMQTVTGVVLFLFLFLLLLFLFFLLFLLLQVVGMCRQCKETITAESKEELVMDWWSGKIQEIRCNETHRRYCCHLML